MPTARPAALPALVLTALFVVAGCGADGGDFTLETEARVSGSAMLLQAVSPAGGGVVWVSGHGGTWARSTDGGASWTTGVVPGADSLQFRDVHGFDAERAVLLAAGPGPLSRLYRTDDGGASWTGTFQMPEADGFLDCMAFVDEQRGWAWGDAVAGRLYLLETADGGRSWARVEAARLPDALEGEGGFAASGDCVAATPAGGVAIATGAGARPRLLRPVGERWEAVDLPLTAGPSAGATAVGFGEGGFAWVVGGAIGQPLEGARVAVSTDGGATWQATAPPTTEGPLYGGALVTGTRAPTLVVVGPGGIAWSADQGARWTTAHDSSHWAVAFGEGGEGWAVGPRGRITALRLVR